MFATVFSESVKSEWSQVRGARHAKRQGSLGRSRRRGFPYARPLRCEPLEVRALLSGGPWSTDQPYVTLDAGGPPQHGGDPNQAVVTGQAIGQAQFVPGEILVGFEGPVADVFHSQGAEQALAKAGKMVEPLGLTSGKPLFKLPATANGAARLATQWKLPASADVQQTAAQLEKLQGVAYAEPNGIMTMDLTAGDPSFTGPEGWPFGLQEHLIDDDLVGDINASTAWDITEGAGVKVAVLDTGVDLDHPDLDEQVLIVGKGKAPQDDNGHGTHVAGIIAAEINNMSDLAGEANGDTSWSGGTVGVAPEATIMPIKVLGANGSGSWSDIAKGIDTASQNGADIINMSLGGGFSQTVSDAIKAAHDAGALVISSAGNSNREASGHPASDPYSLSVAAVDSSDIRAGFSNYGSSVDIAAPGVDVLSTFIDVNGHQSGTFTGAYGRISGTSMASPVVAGVAALIKSLHTDWGPDQVAARLLATTALANASLETGGYDIDSLNPGYEGKLGAGRVDALKAVGPEVPAPVVIAVGGIGADAGEIHHTDPTISVQFSHVMDGASVLTEGNYELLYLGADGVVGGDDDTLVDLTMLSTSYDAFPGRGVELQVDGAINDGTYTLTVESGISTTDGTSLLPYTRTFTVDSTPIEDFKSVEPLGSLVYEAHVTDTFNGNGDVDTFTIDLDGNPEQLVSVEVNSALGGVSIAATYADTDGLSVTILDLDTRPDAVTVGPLPAGTLTLKVTGPSSPVSQSDYSIDVLLNAVRDAELNDDGGNTLTQDLGEAFVTLATLPDGGTADRAAVLGSIGGQIGPRTEGGLIETIESFDDGNKDEYTEQSKGKDRSSNTSVTEVAAHDGTYGLQDETNSGTGGWLYRDDTTVHVARGDTISVWVRSEGTPSGRGYFGFGSDSTGTLSMQMAANTGELILGRHSSYTKYENLGVVRQSWEADHWYRFEIEWQTDGDIIGRLYDSDGTTLLNTVTGHDDTFTAGGIAFRSFYSTKYFDTVEVGAFTSDPEDVYSFTLANGQTATIVATTLEGTVSDVEWSSNGGDWNVWTIGAEMSITDPDDGLPGTYYVRVTGDVGTEYSLLVLRSALFDDGDITVSQELTADRPVALGYVRSGPRLFAVSRSDENSIVELNPQTGVEISRIPAPEPASGGPDALAFDGTSLFFLNGFGTDTLFELDPDTGEVLDFDPVTGGSGDYDGLAAVIETAGDEEVTKVYIVDYSNDDILEFDPSSDTVTNVLTVDANLIGGLAGIGDALIATESVGSSVLEIDPSNGTISNSFEVGGGSVYGVAVVKDEIYLGRASGSVIDVYSRDGEFQRSIDLPGFSVSALGGDDVVPVPEDDYYKIELAEGQTVTLTLQVPAGGSRQFVNQLDPAFKVTDPGGNTVTLENGTFKASAAGDYTIRVYAQNETSGEYILIDPPVQLNSSEEAAADQPLAVFLAAESGGMADDALDSGDPIATDNDPAAAESVSLGQDTWQVPRRQSRASLLSSRLHTARREQLVDIALGQQDDILGGDLMEDLF